MEHYKKKLEDMGLLRRQVSHTPLSSVSGRFCVELIHQAEHAHTYTHS